MQSFDINDLAKTTVMIQLPKPQRIDRDGDDTYLDTMDEREMGKRRPVVVHMRGLYIPYIMTSRVGVIIK